MNLKSYYNRFFFLKNLEEIINNYEYTFKIYLNNISFKKISNLILNNIILFNNKKSIFDISEIKIINNNFIQIKPYNIKYLKIIYNNLLKENILNLNIIKYKKHIEINIPLITRDKKLKIIDIINKKLELIKINIRNNRRIFNNKVILLLKEKKISIDEKNKILKEIDIYINKKIKNIENISILKKSNILNI